MSEKQFDCIVIGSGPGGYVAAIRAAQLGLKTAIVERESLGGICLNWGCIPTKALLKSAEVLQTMRHAENFGLIAKDVNFDFGQVIERSRQVAARMEKGVQFLMKKNKISVLTGHARFVSSNEISVTPANGGGAAETYRFSSAIIATGGRARTLPQFPVDGERVLTYRHALALRERPEKMLVIGAGAIGIEFAYFYSSFGTEVTVVEVLDNLLPIEDEEISKTVQRSLEKSGIRAKLKTGVESLERKGENVSALLKSGEKAEQWIGDYCLVAIGIQGNVEDLGLEKVGIQPERSFIKVDKQYRTQAANIYAIGDVIGPPQLAHVASHEGIIAAEVIAGEHPHALDYGAIAACTYCQPQVASIGMTEKAAREAGKKYRVGKFPFTASGKAVATNETEGMVKVIIDEEIEEVLGVHIVHAEATELISEAAVIKSHEGIASSVFNTVHPHPTLSEAVMEAFGAALGRPIHI